MKNSTVSDVLVQAAIALDGGRWQDDNVEGSIYNTAPSWSMYGYAAACFYDLFGYEGKYSSKPEHHEARVLALLLCAEILRSPAKGKKGGGK